MIRKCRPKNTNPAHPGRLVDFLRQRFEITEQNPGYSPNDGSLLLLCPCCRMCHKKFARVKK